MPGIIHAAEWDRFCGEHGPHFSQIVSVASLVRDPEALAGYVHSALSAATTRSGPEDRALPRIRVFRGPSFDYAATEAVTFGGFDGTDLPGWLQRVHPEPVCLAFNEIDSWDQDLADVLYQELTAPLVQRVGELRAGVDWYSFIGESGWTPFGIHYDNESSMIFHLGPEPKRVWVWDTEVLPELPHGRRISLDFAELLPSAHSFVLEPGDFLSIPAFHMHVFENTGHSTFLGLTIFPVDARAEHTDLVDALVRGGATRDLTAVDTELVASELERIAMRRRSRGYSKIARRQAQPTEPQSVERTRYRVTDRPLTLTESGSGPATLHVCGRDVDLPEGVHVDRFLALLNENSTITGTEALRALAPLGPERGAIDIIRAVERCWGLRPVGSESP